MTDNESQSTSQIPDATLEKKNRSISTVWVIPIIAALISGWLVFKSATEEKAVVEVTFKSASGLEAGKTAVKLRNIKVGEVTEVKFSKDLSEVVIVMALEGIKQERLTESTRFWVVKPRIGAGGVSGLETLVSGAFIEIDPGEGGRPVDRFVGMEEPHIYQLDNPGTTYILKANELGSLSRGTPIKFRDIQVGSVTKYKLAEDHTHVEIEIFVRAPHDKYVKQKTRFWNVSGLDLEFGAEGIKLSLDSMASLLAGGISISTEGIWKSTPQATEKTIFTLYDTEYQKIEESITFGAPMKLYFENGVSGLSKKAPVEFKGLRLGTVVDIGVELDDDKGELTIFAMIIIEPDRLPLDDQRTVLSEEERTKLVYHYIERMVSRGMRAQLKSGNFLTGKSVVSFDFFPAAEKEVKLKYIDGVPLLPTMPEQLVGVVGKVNNIMDKLETLPIEELIKNIDDTMTSFEESMASINSLAKSFNAAEDGMMGIQIRDMMDELSKSARSLRIMTDYLERHPESLLRGKTAN